MQFKIRLISTDFDGTIHNPDDTPPIAFEWLERVRVAQTAGAKWVVNTGRELGDVVEKLRLLAGDTFPDFIVAVEREIHERDHDRYVGHASWNANCRIDHLELFIRAGNVLNKIQKWVETRFAAQIYADAWSPLCIIASHPPDAEEIHSRVEEECRSVPGLLVVRNAHYFRFGHHHYSKGTALAEIARRLGLEKMEIFAAGDHFNDLSMLDGVHAGRVAAPSNAISEVKIAVAKAGGYIASRPCSLGILEALEFFEIN